MAGRERLRIDRVMPGAALSQVLTAMPEVCSEPERDRAAARPTARSRRLHWMAMSLAACVTDALAVLICGLSSFALAAEPGMDADLLTWFVLAAAPLVAVACLQGRKLYSRTAILRPVSVGHVALGWLQAFGLVLVMATAGVALRHGDRHGLGLMPVPSRLGQAWTILFVCSSLAALVLVRIGWAGLRRLLLRAGIVHSKAVVVGAGPLARTVLADLRGTEPNGVDVIGTLGGVDGASPGVPHLGPIDALPAIVEREMVDTVVIALPWAEAPAIDEAIRTASRCLVDIRLAADPIAAAFLHRPLARIADMPIVNVDDIPISGRSAVLKRLEDVALAGLALVAILPLLLLIAAAIKLDSPGPVLFRQPRRGLGNRVFTVCKFRTMHADAADLGAARQTSKGDPRVTRVGAILRRHSFDELPQLLNVLVGDMSLVGPRPHALSTTAGGVALEEALETYAARHRVRPGITGWAQVNGWRGEMDTPEKLTRRVECDLWYIEHWSLLLDLKILARTCLRVVSDAHAY